MKSSNTDIKNKENGDFRAEVNPIEEIESSPFYLNADSALPNGTKVKKGGLYFMDDSGAVIFQLTNHSRTSKKALSVTLEDEIEPRGAINLDKKYAAIISGAITGAISYKNQDTGQDSTDFVELSNGFNIRFLRKVSGKIPLLEGEAKKRAIKVKIVGQKDYFYLFNVANKNHQVPVWHTIDPVFEIKNMIELCDNASSGMKEVAKLGTETAVTGAVYLQYKNEIYMGLLDNTFFYLEDPDAIFREF